MYLKNNFLIKIFVIIIFCIYFVISLSCGTNKKKKEFDPLPPTGSITINKNAKYTNSTFVSLTLKASDDNEIGGMCISNTDTLSNWEPFKEKIDWELLPSEGEKTVYVWFKDIYDNINEKPYTDTIILDITSPKILSTTPSPDTINIPVTTGSISAVLSESISHTTINFELKRGVFTIDGNIKYDSSANTLSFVLNSNLEYSCYYKAKITKDIKDLAGNALLDDYTWEFRTESDGKLPEVISTIPGNDTNEISLDTLIKITFSEFMDISTINDSTFNLFIDTILVSGVVTYNEKTAVFTPSIYLEPFTTYEAKISKDVKDLDGNNMISDYKWKFITGDLMETIPSKPQNLKAASGNQKVKLTWDYIQGDIWYNIYWDTRTGVTKKTGTKISSYYIKSPYTHNYLTNGVTYYYIITAENDYGESEESDEVSATPLAFPSTPEIATITPSDSQIKITWYPVDDALSYNLYWSTIKGVNKSNGEKITNVTSPYSHNGLINGTKYYYVLVAENAYGESLESKEVSASPGILPSAPTGITASPGDKKITISWDSVQDAVSYNIYYSTSSGVSKNSYKISSVTSPYVHTGRSIGTTYFYVVTTKNNYGESIESNEVSATAWGIPQPPSIVSLTPGDKQMKITWSSSTGATAYNIYWSTNIGVNKYNGNKISNVSSPYIQLGLNNGTTYCYVITAENNYGESAESNEYIAKPGVPPLAPAGVTASPGDKRVTITWDSVQDAVSYNIYYSTSSGVSKDDYAITGVTSPYVHTGRSVGVTYYYIITAENSYGESVESIEVSATPWGIPLAPSITVNAEDSQVKISWYSVTGATSYNIYWSESSSITKTSGNKIPNVISPYTLTGLTNGTTYYFVATAENSYGESSMSSEKIAKPSPPPIAPTGVTATPGDGKVILTWNSVTNATSYNIYYSYSSGVSKTNYYYYISSAISPYTHNYRTNGTRIYYVITAENSSGESSESAEVSAIPNAQ